MSLKLSCWQPSFCKPAVSQRVFLFSFSFFLKLHMCRVSLTVHRHQQNGNIFPGFNYSLKCACLFVLISLRLIQLGTALWAQLIPLGCSIYTCCAWHSRLPWICFNPTETRLFWQRRPARLSCTAIPVKMFLIFKLFFCSTTSPFSCFPKFSVPLRLSHRKHLLVWLHPLTKRQEFEAPAPMLCQKMELVRNGMCV